MWDHNSKFNAIIPAEFLPAGQVRNQAPFVSLQCPLYKRKVGKLFPGDSKPRTFIQPYDTQYPLAYGDMRL
eukprot:7672767-Karenia_brevis.AAC.1